MLKVIVWTTESVRSALRDRKGVSALEYGVLAVGIVGAVALAAGTLGTKMSSLFSSIGTDL